MGPENEPLSNEGIEETGSDEESISVSTEDLVARGGAAIREELHELEREAHDLERTVQGAEQQHRSVLSTGVPVLLLVLALEGVVAELVFNYLAENLASVGPLWRLFLGTSLELPIGDFWFDVLRLALRTLPFWLLTLGIVWPFYHFRVRAPLIKARKKLYDCEDRILRERLATPGGRFRYLQEEVRRLSHVTARVFMDNEKRYNQAKKWREEAEDILDYGVEGNLGQAQSLISSINELVLREEGELRAQRSWRFVAVAIIIGYIVALLAITFANAGYPRAMVPVFGVPLSVAMWAAAGSLAAILYRFYTEEERVRLDLEVRWLIARPFIGIIMGMVSYLAITAGLLLLSTAPASGGEGSDATARLEVYWVVAFAAGFSDKFYLRIIDLLVERTLGDTKEEVDKREAAQAGENDQQSPGTEPSDGDGTATSQDSGE